MSESLGLLCYSEANTYQFLTHLMSCIIRKPVFGLFHHFLHKPGCTTAEDGWRLEIPYLRSRGIELYMSLVMRKPFFCICENKDADQLRGNRKADQPPCFRYIDSTITLLSKSEISSLYSSSVAVQPGLCLTWSETLKTGFLRTRPIGSENKGAD